jgi:hypothetical protein
MLKWGKWGRLREKVKRKMGLLMERICWIDLD